MVRESDVEDGAAETMLTNEKNQLAQKEEVKFISSDHKNGEAKIDIGSIEKTFTGMTKEELMKYANDPFWVRLRWIFFILFWALWIAMLVGAILIIVGAPKCAAPTPLQWYKRGPLALVTNDADDANIVETVRAANVKGVIYEIPADETYFVDSPSVQEKLKALVKQFKDFPVIFDLTANFVTANDTLYQTLLENNDSDLGTSVFVTIKSEVIPKGLISTVEGTAWQPYDSTLKEKYLILSQFGDQRYDVRLDSAVMKQKLKGVFKTLVDIGAKGFRLKNAQHSIISHDKLVDETPLPVENAIHSDYKFWTHTQTTYQDGLGDLLNEFSLYVKNITQNEGFLSVTDTMINVEVFKTSTKDRSVEINDLSVELPVYGLLPHTLALGGENAAKKLKEELTQSAKLFNVTWVQYQYDENTLEKSNVNVSAYNIFIMLLPGVPIANVKYFTDNTTSYIKDLQSIRESASYMYGSFDVYTASNDTIIAYTRTKSGNPGYLVVFNPTDAEVSTDFSKVDKIPDQLTVVLFNNESTNIAKDDKVSSSNIKVAAYGAIVLSYVPKSS